MTYTDEMKAFAREVRPGRNWDEFADLFEREFGTRLSRHQVQTLCRLAGTRKHAPTRGEGHHETPMSEKYQIGDEMEYRGNVWVKVAKGANPENARSIYKSGLWQKKQNLVWEQANGQPLPEGHVVMFADNNRRNFDPENLVAVPIGISQIVYGMKLPHHDRASLETCIALARVRSAISEKRKKL